MAMDANELREKLKNIEALMNKLQEAHHNNNHHHHQQQQHIADSSSHRVRREGVVGLRCHGDGCHGDCSNSNGISPSWETTMCGLAKELETICSAGSSPRDSPNASVCLTPTNPDAPPSRRTVSCGSGGGGRMSHQGSLFDDPAPSSSTPCPSGARTVRVRHEETEESLDRSLTMICRQHQLDHHPDEKAPGGVGGGGTKHRDSVRYGLRFRVDLTGRDPDQTTVSVDTEDHILRVYSGGETIHLLQLAEKTDPRTLSCTVIDDGATLFIKQRAKETVCIEMEAPAPPRHSSSSSPPSSSSSSSTSFSSTEVHLPVVRSDESNLTTTVTLRLPPCLHGNDDAAAAVVVKTIDDTLMIRLGVAAAAPAPLHSETPGDGAGSGGEARLCVVMNLPEGTDSRSVRAWAVKGQLTVKGRLVPASRRMTCTF